MFLHQQICVKKLAKLVHSALLLWSRITHGERNALSVCYDKQEAQIGSCLAQLRETANSNYGLCLMNVCSIRLLHLSRSCNAGVQNVHEHHVCEQK